MENSAIDTKLYNFHRLLQQELHKLEHYERMRFNAIISQSLSKLEFDPTQFIPTEDAFKLASHNSNAVVEILKRELATLKEWRSEQEVVWKDVIEHGQSSFKMPYGASLAVEVLRRLKEYEILFP